MLNYQRVFFWMFRVQPFSRVHWPKKSLSAVLPSAMISPWPMKKAARWLRRSSCDVPTGNHRFFGKADERWSGPFLWKLYRVVLFDMAMDQYLLIPFLVGWTSINPSYFDVNYRGTRVLTHPHIYLVRNFHIELILISHYIPASWVSFTQNSTCLGQSSDNPPQLLHVQQIRWCWSPIFNG